MSAKLLDLSTLSEGQVRRVKELRRAFQRSLNHMPTTIQRTLIDRAAVPTAKAEAAALDPNVCTNDVGRIVCGGVDINNTDFDAFRKASGRGGDLKVLSDVKATHLDRPDTFLLP